MNFGVLINYGGLWNDHFETTAQINQSFCFLFCAVCTWSDDFPASGFWTVQDGQAAISRCWLLRAMQQRLRMPENTACQTRCRCGSESAFQSATENRCFWWLRRTIKFPRPHMARSASAYWLAIRERRFSTKSGSMWKILARSGI